MIVQGCGSEHQPIASKVDRLAGLEKFLSDELVDQILTATGKQSRYRSKLSHDVMMRVVVGVGLFTDKPIRQVYRACRRCTPHTKTPARSSLCIARQRLGSTPLRELYRRVVRPLATANTPGAFYGGMRKVAIDGTVLDTPDCDALQHFGRSSGSRGEGPFPQVRKVSLVECGTHIEFDFVYGGWHDSEKKLVEELWNSIPEDALLIEDRGFFSYKHWEKLDEKHSLLIRVQKAMTLKPIRRLADGSFLAKIYPSNWYRKRRKRGILVRVIEYKLDDPQRPGHGELHRLMTNLIDAEAYPAKELICEYHERWESELVFDEQKTHQDPRRAEKPTQLRSETPDGIAQELYALSLGHFITRAIMLDAAAEASMDVDRLSFKGCFQIIQLRLPECSGRSPQEVEWWYLCLLAELREEVIPPRRNRINSRVIKRKMSRWNKKRPHHRKPPPLRKSFAETIVIEK